MYWLADPERKLDPLRKEIRETLVEEMQGAQHEDELQFLTHQQIEDIWTRQRSQQGSYFERFAKILRLKGPAKERVHLHQLRIISTLVWIRFDQWTQYFMKEFVPEDRGRVDSGLPFDERELRQMVFDFSRDFFHEQFRFLPVRIHEMKPATYTRGSSEQEPEHQKARMPFLRKDKEEIMHERVGIKVTKERIPPQHMVKKSGKQINEERIMAVKSFPASRIDDFTLEKGNLELLKDSVLPNPNILFSFAAIQIGRSRGSARGYIISNLADCNLGELLFGLCGRFEHRKAKFTPYFLLSEMKGVASAIQWLHDGVRKSETNEIIRCTHMDLKPSNILIFWDDPPETRWKISDFGISDVRHSGRFGSGDRPLTFTRAKQYPAEYQAPEVEFQKDKVGIPSDVWSFGCMLMDVVALIIGGPDAAEHLQTLRNKEAPNYFYSTADHSLKPQMVDWLRVMHHSAPWIPQTSLLIQDILKTDYNQRPKAHRIVKSLGAIIDQYEETDMHKSCPWTQDPESLRGTAPILTPLSGSTQTPSTHTVPDRLFPHFEIRNNFKVSSFVVKKFGVRTKSRMSLEGEWAVFRTVELAFAVRIEELPWQKTPVLFKNIRETGVLLKRRSHQIEAVASAGGFVAALFCPLDPRNVDFKKIQIRGSRHDELDFRGPASGLSISINGDCLIHRDDGELTLRCLGSQDEKSLKLKGAILRTAAFSHDGNYIYAWSRSNHFDYWEIWTSDGDRFPGFCNMLINIDTPRGSANNILVPWRGTQAFNGLEPHFLTIDTHGNGSIIGEEGGKLNRFGFAARYDGITHGSVIPNGTAAIFIRRGHLNSVPGFVLLDLSPSISTKWHPSMREVDISSSFIHHYDPKYDDFVLQQSGAEIVAYLSGPTRKPKDAIVIRKAVIAPP